MLARAEDLLYGKVENPIGAAIGGYALLRTGNLERLHDWPVNLANMFGWLPDGAVIAGEQAYRQGDREGARTWFLQAAGRGLPLLTDGFSMLLSRLRELALERAAAPEPALAGVADAGAGPPDGSGEGGGKEPALARLRRWSGYMDFSSLFVRARTADLADPGKGQHPLSEFTSAGGWRRFHGVGIARDPRDFWTSPEG